MKCMLTAFLCGYAFSYDILSSVQKFHFLLFQFNVQLNVLKANREFVLHNPDVSMLSEGDILLVKTELSEKKKKNILFTLLEEKSPLKKLTTLPNPVLQNGLRYTVQNSN